MGSTVRILHLLDEQPEFQTERGVESLCAKLGDGFAARTRRFQPGGYRDLAQAILSLRRTDSEGFDLIHAWGRRALAAAAIGSRLPIIYTPDATPTHRDIAWVRAAMGYRRVEIVFPTSTQRRMHVERGVLAGNCHLIRPGVDFARVRRRRDTALRATFGFSDDDRVLLACGESTLAANHRESIWAAAILHLLDPRFKLLLWGKGPALRGIRHLADESQMAGAFVFARDHVESIEFEALLPATDAVLVNAQGAVATLPIAISMAAGLPIISTVTYTTSELLEDRHTALMVPPSKPRQFARRVLDLYADPRLQWSIAETARAEAYEYHSLTRFLNEYRAFYKKIALGEPPAIAAPSSTSLRVLQNQM